MFAQILDETPTQPPVDPFVSPTTFWLWSGLSSLLGYAYLAFLIWILVECLRRDPDRFLWFWVILIFQPLGAIIYFFVRWLPHHRVRLPKAFRRWTRGKEIQRLEAAASQIGNAHQFVQLGDALRETGRFPQAATAYARAIEKDPENLQALWGAALVDMRRKNFSTAHERLEKVLAVDPQYKFGDVSLARGKALYELGRADEARDHLEGHVRRWRHPEALYLLATIHFEQGDARQARSHLQAMLLDISGSPKAIARKYGFWKSKARRLLRKLPRGSDAA